MKHYYYYSKLCIFLPVAITAEFSSQKHKQELGMRFKFFTGVNMKITVIWNLTSCSLVGIVMLQIIIIIIIIIKVTYKLPCFCTLFVSVLFIFACIQFEIRLWVVNLTRK
jgi:hypothetical protein